jgi:hypothetical protein
LVALPEAGDLQVLRGQNPQLGPLHPAEAEKQGDATGARLAPDGRRATSQLALVEIAVA